MTRLSQVSAYLDRELRVDRFQDSALNGLQVENSGRVRRVACGVDASLPLFEAAAARGADLVICHHGISWGESLRRLTGLNYRWLSFLMRHDMALYASHLPLDAHPRLGNNALLARALGLRGLKPFGLYKGNLIGFGGTLPRPMPAAAFQRRVERAVGRPAQAMAFGPARVRRVAVVSGGAADELAEAVEKGFDAYVSGEPTLWAYNVAQQQGIHAFFAGHYATEVFGVRALAGVVARRFCVPAEFIDLQTPF